MRIPLLIRRYARLAGERPGRSLRTRTIFCTSSSAGPGIPDGRVFEHGGWRRRARPASASWPRSQISRRFADLAERGRRTCRAARTSAVPDGSAAVRSSAPRRRPRPSGRRCGRPPPGAGPVRLVLLRQPALAAHVVTFPVMIGRASLPGRVYPQSFQVGLLMLTGFGFPLLPGITRLSRLGGHGLVDRLHPPVGRCYGGPRISPGHEVRCDHHGHCPDAQLDGG
jgi:hypothetical protein